MQISKNCCNFVRDSLITAHEYEAKYSIADPAWHRYVRFVCSRFVADLCLGSTLFPLRALWEQNEAYQIYHHILVNLRLPKALTAILAGSALSVSGILMQTLFRNPLAGPYILGVSSGASLGVAFVVMCTSLFGMVSAGTGTIATSAIIGSTLVLLLVMSVAGKVKDNVSLLIVGMMVGAVAGALVNIMQNIANGYGTGAAYRCADGSPVAQAAERSAAG